MLTGFLLDAPPLVAPMVHALLAAEASQSLVRKLRPPLPRVLDPLASVEDPALRRAALGRVRWVRAREPLLRTALDAVVLPLGDHQVRVRVVLLRVGVPTRVDGERVGQRLAGGQLLRELVGEGDL